MKHRFLITGILLVLMIIAACLKTFWAGFIYFAVSLLALISFYWFAIFIYQYIDDYKWHFEDDFLMYKATVINSTAISETDFEAGRKVYEKKFKKTLIRDKIIDIFKILICLSIAITCIATLCSGVVR